MPAPAPARFRTGLRSLARPIAVAAAVIAAHAAAGAQTLTADYRLEGSRESSVAGAPALRDLGLNSFVQATVDGRPRQVLRFGANNGVEITPVDASLMPGGRYTIAILFELDTVSGYRRLVDFLGGTSDNGAYIHDGRLEHSNGTDEILPNTYVQVVYTRDGSRASQVAYVDGRVAVRGTDPDVSDLELLVDTLRFFRDNTGPEEASAGTVARIRIYDGPLTQAQAESLDRLPAVGPNMAPEVEGPRVIYAIVSESTSFDVIARDPDGDPLALRLASPAVPGASFLDRGDGTGTYTILAPASIRGTDHVLRFEADDGRGGLAETSVVLRVGFERGANPPRAALAGRATAPFGGLRRVTAKAGEPTEVILEALDPDGQPVTVAVEADGGLSVSVAPTSEPNHFKISVAPVRSQRGQMMLSKATVTDAAGTTTAASFVVDVPGTAGIEVVPVEVWWEQPPPDYRWAAPVNVEVTQTTVSGSIQTGDALDLLGYAVYASTNPGFEPGADTLVATALPTERSVVFARTRPSGDRTPLHVKVTARRASGEGRASPEAGSDEPHVPDGIVFSGGKLVLPDTRTNFVAGTVLEIRQTPDGPGERFTLAPNKKGTKWTVKKSAASTPGGRRLSDVLAPGRQAYLVAINPGGTASAVKPFVP